MKEYFTDQELERLIEQLEGQELYAPRHMKEQILRQAFPKQTGGALPQSGGGEEAVRLFPYHHDSAGGSDRMRSRDRFYRLKIIAGMAAALFLLVALPVQGDGRYEDRHDYGIEYEDRDGTIDINRVINEHTWEVNRRINSWFDRISGFHREIY